MTILPFALVALSLSSLASANVHARHHAYMQRRDHVLARDALPAATGAATQTVTTSAAIITTPTVPGTFIPPLEQLTQNAAIETPLSMFTTFTAGATAPLSGAPALPTINIVSTNYPGLDAIPPVDSPQVKQWLSEIDLSGVPNLQKTINGSCELNPQLAADTTRCWWTCGGCTRPTDIVACPDKLDWGVSYDDGPSPYTPKLVNYLHEKNITATFFVVGSRVISRPEMLQTEYMLGHEISIHTWSHSALTNLTNEEIVAELGWTRQAIKDVIGVSPRTMRPPYGDIDDRVRAVVTAMGLTPIIWTAKGDTTFDTDDWQIPAGNANGTSSFAAWQQIEQIVGTLDTGFIVLEHDLYQQSVDMAVGYIIPEALKHTPAFKLSSVIQCLNEPASNAYAELYKNVTVAGSSTSKNGTPSSSTGSGALPITSMSAISALVAAAAAAFVVL